MDYRSSFKFLINFQRANNNIAVIASVNIEEEPKKITLVRELPCSLSLFLGNPNIEQPPLFILNDDRQSFYVLMNDPEKGEEDSKYLVKSDSLIKGNLNTKIKMVYCTPLRSGYCVIYQNYNENILRFSKNRLSEYDVLDFNVLDTDFVFKTDNNDTILNVNWQVKFQI